MSSQVEGETSTHHIELTVEREGEERGNTSSIIELYLIELNY